MPVEWGALEQLHMVTMPNAKHQLEGYKATPLHWALEHWSDGAPSNTVGRSWGDVCDPELIILTPALFLRFCLALLSLCF